MEKHSNKQCTFKNVIYVVEQMLKPKYKMFMLVAQNDDPNDNDGNANANVICVLDI